MILATASNDQSIILWDVKTREKISELINQNQGVITVCFSPNGSILATGSFNGTISLWNMKTRKLESEFIGHSGSIIT